MKYIPSVIAFVNRGSFVVDNVEYPLFYPYCGKFQKWPNWGNKSIVLTNVNEFDGFKVVATDDGRISDLTLVNTEFGPVILWKLFSSEEIADIVAESEVGADGFVSYPFGLYGSTNYSYDATLKPASLSGKKWAALKSKAPMRESKFKASELKVGKVYSQLKSSSSYLVYLGRVKNPARDGKLSFCFAEVNPTSGAATVNSPSFLKVVSDRLCDFFSFKEMTNENFRKRILKELKLLPSVPPNLMFEHGELDFSKLSVKSGGKAVNLNEENVESIISETVQDQWVEYMEIVEHRKVTAESTNKWGQKALKWDTPEPPSWLEWSRRARN